MSNEKILRKVDFIAFCALIITINTDILALGDNVWHVFSVIAIILLYVLSSVDPKGSSKASEKTDDSDVPPTS